MKYFIEANKTNFFGKWKFDFKVDNQATKEYIFMRENWCYKTSHV